MHEQENERIKLFWFNHLKRACTTFKQIDFNSLQIFKRKQEHSHGPWLVKKLLRLSLIDEQRFTDFIFEKRKLKKRYMTVAQLVLSYFHWYFLKKLKIVLYNWSHSNWNIGVFILFPQLVHFFCTVHFKLISHIYKAIQANSSTPFNEFIFITYNFESCLPTKWQGLSSN